MRVFLFLIYNKHTNNVAIDKQWYIILLCVIQSDNDHKRMKPEQEQEQVTKQTEIICDICYVRYDEGMRIPRLLPCSHVFCNECLIQMRARTCPKCRLDWEGLFVCNLPQCDSTLKAIRKSDPVIIEIMDSP